MIISLNFSFRDFFTMLEAIGFVFRYLAVKLKTLVLPASIAIVGFIVEHLTVHSHKDFA